MKLLLVVTFFSSFLFAANPFDIFVRELSVVGKPIIRSNKAAFCNRFDFKNLWKVEVRETNRPKINLTHTLYFKNHSGFSGHPIEDFQDKLSKENPVGQYAKTTGTDEVATNERGSLGLVEFERLTVTLQKHSPAEYSIYMKEELVTKGTVIASCEYEAKLEP